MAVNQEIKSQLAKLLATEDLVVENRHVETAQFNVHTRVLTLPMWEKASSYVYDMLVGHEVGHALYTPDRNWLKEVNVPPQIVNIVEDARIEKMMKRRYVGLAKTFYRGYQELSDQDFFQLDGENVDTMNLADRVNLYFKIGNFVDINFNETEKSIITVIDECETFDDVLVASEMLYKYCKSESNNSSSQNDSENSGESDSEDQSDNNNDSIEPESSESYGGTAENKDVGNKFDEEIVDEVDQEDNDLDIKTADSLEESLKNLVDFNASEKIYLEIPEIDIDKVIVDNREIHSRCNNYWHEHSKQTGDHLMFELADKEFEKFKKTAQKEVNYLVKEFECKKAADSYARATTARTGVLDCSKLHTYKYNEDLFRKVTTLADGKNHGLVFVLDWSGSMCDVISDTVKQLFNLIWFCKKVSIPFEVYAFTSDYPINSNDEDGNPVKRSLPYKERAGIFHIGEWFSLMNLLTSKVNGKELNEQMKTIYRLSRCFEGWGSARYSVPPGLSLSGTPLNESMVALHQILPKFKKENNLQKVQCVVLTDGEGYDLKRHTEVQRPWDEDPYIGLAGIGPRCVLRDRKIGTTYSLDCDWYQFTDILLKNLKDKFPDVNFIGMRVLVSRDSGSFIRRYCGYSGKSYETAMRDWKKMKSFSIKNSGYDLYFGISSNSLSKNSDFSVSDDATKTQIKSAFAKSLKTKKMNKKILGEFVELIA